MIRLLPALLLLASAAAAQPGAAALPEVPARPVVGLALSGGAAKGFAHIGVIQVLEEEGVPVDVVSGTSMGALLGGLYAAGYSGKDLEQIVLNLDTSALLFGSSAPGALSLAETIVPGRTLVDVPSRGLRPALPEGLLTGQPLLETLARLLWDVQGVTDFRDLPRPFACNAIDLISGEGVTISSGYLPIAIRTCMSLPGAFRPIRTAEGVFLDGGPDHMLPVDEAHALGADVVIGVDVSGDVDPETNRVRLTPTGNDVNLLVLFEKATGTTRRRRAVADREAADVIVEPDVASLDAAGLGDPAPWIAEGRRAATAALPEIRALVARYGLQPAPVPPSPAEPASVRIERIRFEGVTGDALRLAETVGVLDLPAEISPDDVDRLVARLVATDSYDYVVPRVLPSGVLEVRLVPKDPPDRLGLGLRYDDRNGGEVLAQAVLRHRIRYGDRSAFSVRLGRQSQLTAAYTAPLRLASAVEAGARVGITSAPVRVTLLGEEKERSTVTQRVTDAALVGAWAPLPDLLVGVALGGGVARDVVSDFQVDQNAVFPGPNGVPIVLDLEDVVLRERFASGTAFAEVRTLDRLNVPTRGVRLRAEAEGGRGHVDASEFADRIAEQAGVPVEILNLSRDRSGAFQRALLDGQAFVPVSPRLSVVGRLAYARGSGEGLPLNRRTYVGGMHTVTVLPGTFLPLYGHEPEALTGPNAWLAALGVQAQLGQNLFAHLFANAGRAYGDGDAIVDADDVLTGVGLDLQYRTPVGPLVLSLGTDGVDRLPDVGLRVGYVF